MQTLDERLRDVMTAMNWDRADLMRVSQQSSSVVSQWLGNSTKTIKTIGKLEAALYIERASGFSALWIAKGMGAKRVPRPADTQADHGHHRIGESPSRYAVRSQPDIDTALTVIESALVDASAELRDALATNLAGWARAGGRGPWRQVVQSLLTAPPEKQQHQG